LGGREGESGPVAWLWLVELRGARRSGNGLRRDAAATLAMFLFETHEQTK
jgi:hypothetical protein